MKSVSPSARPAWRSTRRLTLWLGLLLLAGSVPFITHGQRQADGERATTFGAPRTIVDKLDDAPFVPGHVLVRFRSDALAERAEAASAALTLADGEDAAVQVEQFDGSELVDGLRLAHVAPADTLAAIAALNARADVLYAEPDYIWQVDRVPNDPNYGSANMYGLRKIGAEQAWDITTGTDDNTVVVGVLDGGVDVNHPDLRDNIWVNPGEIPGNGIDDDGNGFVDDINGYNFAHNRGAVFDSENGDEHATHVAGTIGARGDNGIGVVGVNWKTRIMSLKVLADGGGSTSDIIRGYNYAVLMRQRGVNLRVLNNSYGGRGFSQAAQDAIGGLNQAGILFVAAAGNDAVNNFNIPHYPSDYALPNMISVAATTSSDSLASFSNFGTRAVNIGAPGASILSTVPASMNVCGTGSAYCSFSGTSMASPHVAGAAALVCAQYPNIAVEQLRGALLYSGDLTIATLGKTTTDRRLNVFKTLQNLATGDATPPAAAGQLRITGQSGRSVSLAWTAPGDDGNTGQATDYDFFFINPINGARILLASSVAPPVGTPGPAGTAQSVTLDLPYRNFSGTIELRTYDKVGLSSTASIGVTVSVNNSSDPYLISETAATSLTTGGTPLNFHADDNYTFYSLGNFSFPYYGQTYTSLVVSSNGVLYLNPQSELPRNSDGTGDDAGSAVADLRGLKMIAGLWDDLRTDNTGGDVFVTQDSERVIFRWQARTYLNTNPDSGAPVNFEIELRRDGTIQIRYGSGNTNVRPVVGISGGDFDPYVVTSHTSEGALINLTNAPNVSFVPRSAAPACTYTLPQASASVSSGGGSFTAGVTTQAGCGLTAAQVTSNAPWLTVGAVTVGGAGAGTVNYTVSANTATAPRTGTLTIAGQTFTVLQAAAVPLCTYTLVQTSSNVVAAGGNFNVGVTTQAGCTLTTSQVTSSAPWLTVDTVTTGSGSGTVNYTAASNNTGVARTGTLTIAGQIFTVTQAAGAPVAPTLQFSAANYSVGEGNGQATITVTRTNDTSGTVTVDYRTADSDTFTVGCADTVNNRGAAFGRCDFATTVDTLSFAPGETSKTFVVPIINDAHVEGNETFQIMLSNPAGAALGTQTTATVTIADNDVAGQANPIFQTPFFVRQQYLDFLAREPEATEPYSALLNNCADVNTGPAVPSGCDRITVSGAFFGSPEFRDKGIYIIVFYRVAFNRLPTYAEFAVDLRGVTGTTGPETLAKRATFATAFTQRPAFGSAYGALADADYVAALFNNLALITTPDPQNPDGSLNPDGTRTIQKVTLTRSDLVARLGSGALTRAQVLRAIVQSDQISTAEATNAFVASQYYGYLRRTPDTGGFNGWISYLTTHPGDFRTMVNGFVNSIEYRLRFGMQ